MIYLRVSALPNLLAARDTLGLVRLTETTKENYLKDKVDGYDRSQVYCFYGNDLDSDETHLYVADYNMNVLNTYKLDCGVTEFGVSNLHTTKVEDITVVLKQTISIKEVPLNRVKNLFSWLSNNALNIFIIPTIKVVDDLVEKASLYVSYQDFIINDVIDENVENILNMTTLLVTKEDTASTILAKVIKKVNYLTYYIEPSKEKTLQGLSVTIGNPSEGQYNKDPDTPLQYELAICRKNTNNCLTGEEIICIYGQKEHNYNLGVEVYKDNDVDVAADSLAKFLLEKVFIILNWSRSEWEAFSTGFKVFVGTSTFYTSLGEPKTDAELIEKVYAELENLSYSFSH